MPMVNDQYRELWEALVRKAAAATNMTYEQVLAELDAGRGSIEIKCTIDTRGMNDVVDQT